MNNTNRIHTNMFDYYIHNTIVDNLVNNTYMNNIIPSDLSKYPLHLQKFIRRQQNFKHDSNNICELHGCTTLNNNGETLDTILPAYSEDISSMNANTKQTKIFLPSKCLRSVDYVKNGYNPKGNDIRNNFNFRYNVDYTDIIFDMICCLAIDCMFKNAEKKQGVAKRWLNYINILNKNPNLLQPDEICDDHIISHMNSYIYECIKGIPSPESDNKEDKPDLAIKPIKIEKDHYTQWNFDIMAELAKRKTEFPGIQEYIYPFFKVNTNKLNVSTFNLPWGERLLDYNDFLSEGETKNYIRSHNNRYTLFVNNYGQFGIKDGGNVIIWYNNFRYNYNTYSFTIQSDCKLAIQSKNGSTIYLITLTDETDFKGPLSIIIDNRGKLVIYENGFKVLNLNKKFKIYDNTLKSDIQTLKINGLWSYIIDENNNNNNLNINNNTNSIDNNNNDNDNNNNDNSNNTNFNNKKCKLVTSEIISNNLNWRDIDNIKSEDIKNIKSKDIKNIKSEDIENIENVNIKKDKNNELIYNEIENFKNNNLTTLSRFKFLHSKFLSSQKFK